MNNKKIYSYDEAINLINNNFNDSNNIIENMNNIIEKMDNSNNTSISNNNTNKKHKSHNHLLIYIFILCFLIIVGVILYKYYNKLNIK